LAGTPEGAVHNPRGLPHKSTSWRVSTTQDFKGNSVIPPDGTNLLLTPELSDGIVPDRGRAKTATLGGTCRRKAYTMSRNKEPLQINARSLRLATAATLLSALPLYLFGYRTVGLSLIGLGVAATSLLYLELAHEPRLLAQALEYATRELKTKEE
jgi:hypothetical protein